jgi:hypothetical protein
VPLFLVLATGAGLDGWTWSTSISPFAVALLRGRTRKDRIRSELGGHDGGASLLCLPHLPARLPQNQQRERPCAHAIRNNASIVVPL